MFSDQTALITGAAVGIGRACALLMAESGANIIAVDRNAEQLAMLQEELAVYKGSVLTFVCDVSDPNAVTEVVSESLKALGKIDILVNNAGIWRCWSTFAETSIEEWKQYIDINLMGTVYFTKAVLDGMLANGYGRIINVASVAGVYGNANMAHYSATKGALIAMTKALAKEVAEKGITVNAVSPGSVSPSQNRDIDYTESSTLSFAGRTGSNRENADLICFLASRKAGYISGQNIQIDGCRKKQ